MNLEEAIIFALSAHTGQKDKAGKPYIFHPFAVMSKMETEEEQMVAVLHDVVEDTHFKVEDLRILVHNDTVVDAVDAISRRKGEIYKDYIRRVKTNPLATKVKLADLEHNMSPDRVNALPENERGVVNRYKWAKEELTRK